jgi:hypothetical protein
MIPVRHLAIAAAAMLLAAALRAGACDLPVFLYALYNWTPDQYGLHVIATNALDDDAARALAQVREIGGESLYLEEHRDDAFASQVWARVGMAALPWLQLDYPAAGGVQRIAWEGPLTLTNLDRLLLSPARAELVRRLVSNECAVWVMLASGDAARDAQMQRELAAALRAAEAQVRLPHQDEDLPEDDVAPYDTNLPLRFSILRVARDDPREAAFVAMVQNPDARLAQMRGPLAIPIFGKGRALTVLSELPVPADLVIELCQFLAGPCACEIKDMNPGVDMLLPVPWRTLLRDGVQEVLQPMPLSGFATLDTNTPAQDAISTMPTPAEAGRGMLRTVVLLVTLLLLTTAIGAGVIAWRARVERP